MDSDAVAFDKLDVPSYWQFRGYGHPFYVNIRYRFPYKPPVIPTTGKAGRTNKKPALVLNANAGFWFTGRQTALRSHQRSLQALQCSHAGADSKDAGNVGQLVGPDILWDRARQHRAVVDGVKADACFAA